MAHIWLQKRSHHSHCPLKVGNVKCAFMEKMRNVSQFVDFLKSLLRVSVVLTQIFLLNSKAMLKFDF